MKKETRILYLHAGGGKAGSSALQSFLEFNSAKLAMLGLSYENKVGMLHQFEISSGNGALLLNAVIDPGCADEDLSRIVLSYFGGGLSAICSSEQFGTFNPEQWAKLSRICEQEGIALNVIYYVRNVVPYVSSAYDQLIKRHGLHLSFEEWVPTAEWGHASALRSMMGGLSREKIKAVSYDAIGGRVVDWFVNLIDAASVFDGGDDLIVNRSLTNIERDVLRRINYFTGSMFSGEISDRMIYANPTIRSDPLRITADIEDMLGAHYQKEIDWVNEVFFDGGSIVSLKGKSRQGAFQQPAAGQVEDTSDHLKKQIQVRDMVMDWALERLSTAHQTSIDQIAGALMQVDWQLAMDPAIPKNFDPIVYLLNNVDLILAGVPPYAHFLSHGQFEGRVWASNIGAGWSGASRDAGEFNGRLRELEEHAERQRIRQEHELTEIKLEGLRQMETLLRQQVEREQGHSMRVASTYAEVERERATMLEMADRKYDALMAMHFKQMDIADRKLSALNERLDQARLEVQAALGHQLERERRHAEQMASAASDSARQIATLNTELSMLRRQLEQSQQGIDTSGRQEKYSVVPGVAPVVSSQ